LEVVITYNQNVMQWFHWSGPLEIKYAWNGPADWNEFDTPGVNRQLLIIKLNIKQENNRISQRTILSYLNVQALVPGVCNSFPFGDWKANGVAWITFLVITH